MSHGASAAAANGATGGGASAGEFHEYQWAYSVMDSSRVSTCLISMLLIVYGSFRSLNMEQEAREREQKKRQSDSLNNLITGEPVSIEQSWFSHIFLFWVQKRLGLIAGHRATLVCMCCRQIRDIGHDDSLMAPELHAIFHIFDSA